MWINILSRKEGRLLIDRFDSDAPALLAAVVGVGGGGAERRPQQEQRCKRGGDLAPHKFACVLGCCVRGGQEVSSINQKVGALDRLKRGV
jgi:hypothetical protein